MQALRTASREDELHRALRALPVRRDVVLYESGAASLAARSEPPTPLELASFATDSCRRQPRLWSERVRQQYRWALLRL